MSASVSVVRSDHNVVASITDPSQNVGTATQVLTIDTSAPAVSISGGATSATNDLTPTIAGTTDEPAGTTSTSTVGGQALTTTANGTGHWSVEPTTLAESPYAVVAHRRGRGPEHRDCDQVLSVDVTVPVVTIDGGATSSTTDTSPWIYGTTAEQAGTTVHVAIGGQAPDGDRHRRWHLGCQRDSTRRRRLRRRCVSHRRGRQHRHGRPNAHHRIGPAIAVQARRGDPPAEGNVGRRRYLHGLRATRDQTTARTCEDCDGSRSASPTAATRPTDIKVKGTAASTKFTVTYLLGTKDVTAAVTAGSYRTKALAPGASGHLVVKVTRTTAAVAGDSRAFKLATSSSHRPTMRDVVTAVVRVGAARTAA